MLVLSAGKTKDRVSEWIYIDTSDGTIKVKAKIFNGDFRIVIDAPKNCKINREKFTRTVNDDSTQ